MRKPRVPVTAPTPKLPPNRSRLMALEPRYLFDGVALSDVLHERLQTEGPPDLVGETAVTARQLSFFETPAAVDAAPVTGREFMFVDPSVVDYAALVAAARPGVQVVLLDASRDGVQQITDFLAGLKDVQAIYLVSHGAQGDLHLAASDLNPATLKNYAAQLSAWQANLSAQADILIYGCDVAQGSSGAALVNSLARLTAADVAASTDATGNAAAGGNWTLEYQSGLIEAKSAFAANSLAGFMGLLDLGASPTITATTNTGLTTPEDTPLDLAGKLSVDAAEASINMEAVITVTGGG